MTLARPMFPPRADRASASRETAEAPYVRSDVSPEDLFKALGRLRREAADEIERLIAFLDEIGPDVDLEPSGDELDLDADSEPVLASPEHHPSGYRDGCGRFAWNRSRRDSDGTQVLWGNNGNFDDRELCSDIQEDDSHDGREPDVCDEPSLGSFDRLIDQHHGWRQTAGSARTWLSHGNCDAELEHSGREPDVDREPDPDPDREINDDTGIGDADGLMEQCSGLSSNVVGHLMQVA